jgi:hypothetical protein
MIGNPEDPPLVQTTTSPHVELRGVIVGFPPSLHADEDLAEARGEA